MLRYDISNLTCYTGHIYVDYCSVVAQAAELKVESLDERSAADGMHVLTLDAMLLRESLDGVVFGLICHKEYLKLD